MDIYLEREIELNQLHEDILARREVLLRHSEWHLGNMQKRKANSAAVLAVAKERNQNLLEDINKIQADLRSKGGKGFSPKLQAFQESYWSMMEKELPGWKGELRAAKKSPRSPRPPHPHSK
ncbi:centrosomal protein 15-like [Glandiceps talaboti]